MNTSECLCACFIFLFTDDTPVGRYVTVNTLSNYETQFVHNLLAFFTGIQNTTFSTCNECNDAQSDSNQVPPYTDRAYIKYGVEGFAIEYCWC